MKRISVVTGTRAEYGLLKPIIQKIIESKRLDLSLVVTGMHLSNEFGLTVSEIENDGIPITYRCEMLLGSDTSSGITKSIGVELMGLADYFATQKIDMIIILGDRYEMLGAAVAAMIARIPIAHIGGGEKTEGAMDESIRHAITKLSYLHFTSTEEYFDRVIQLGEMPDKVFNVGALGVENVKKVPCLSKTEVEERIGFAINKRTVMVTYHPTTLENRTSKEQFEQILRVLESHKELGVIFTKANSDPDGRIINEMIDTFVANNRERSIGFYSLGQLLYINTIRYCDVVLGNSSSGLIEVPSLEVPTVNIGDRQLGRLSSESVIHCGNKEIEINEALIKALSPEFHTLIKNTKNPYEGVETSSTIISKIVSILSDDIVMKKEFNDKIVRSV